MADRKTPPADIARFPHIAQPNIEQVLEQFLDDQANRLKPRTLACYRGVVELLQHHLDGYGYESLGKEESSFFDHHFEAAGSHQRSFCQLFGADKITENLGGFLGYFMIRKVVAGEELKRAAGTVSKKLARWLEQRVLEPETLGEIDDPIPIGGIEKTIQIPHQKKRKEAQIDGDRTLREALHVFTQ